MADRLKAGTKKQWGVYGGEGASKMECGCKTTGHGGGVRAVGPKNSGGRGGEEPGEATKKRL